MMYLAKLKPARRPSRPGSCVRTCSPPSAGVHDGDVNGARLDDRHLVGFARYDHERLGYALLAAHRLTFEASNVGLLIGRCAPFSRLSFAR
jgi:hypothetical protein